MNAAHRKLLIDLLSLPTAPLNEHYVSDAIRRWAADRPAIQLRADAFGNLRLRLRRGAKRVARPLLFSAHMDHPGFEAAGMTRPNRCRAIWRGGVPPEYFKNGRVRFFCDGRWVRGLIKSVRTVGARDRRRVDRVSVAVEEPVARGSIGMWDLPDPVIRGKRIYARGCDDIAGLAAVLAALDELHRSRASIDLYATFTRAEEVGFAGAIAGSRGGLIPKRARVIAVECSPQIPGVKMGDGPILRVGDRASVFSPELTAFCRQVGRDLARKERRFTFQRKLMDGGTCESTAFCELGFEATWLCLALGNYHNIDRQRRRIAAEYIDLDDFDRLVQWFVALARSKRSADHGDPELGKALNRLDRQWSRQLERTARRR